MTSLYLYDYTPPGNKGKTNIPSRAEWEAYWNTPGLGALVDTISATVVEERNGAYELTLTYKANAPLADKLSVNRIIMSDVTSDMGYRTHLRGAYNQQPFRIYEVIKNMKGVITVKAEHMSYAMNGYYIHKHEARPPHTSTNTEWRYLTGLEYMVELWRATRHPYQNDEITANLHQVTLNDDLWKTRAFIKYDIIGRSFTSAIMDGDASLLGQFGGECVRNWFDLNIYKEVSEMKSEYNEYYRIDYGNNMTGFNLTYNIDNLATQVYPFCKIQVPINMSDNVGGVPITEDKWRWESIEITPGNYHYTIRVDSDDTSTPMIEKTKRANVIPLDLSEFEPSLQNAWKGDKGSTVSVDIRKGYVVRAIKELTADWVKYNRPQMVDINCEVDFLAIWESEEYKDYEYLQRLRLCDYCLISHPDIPFPVKVKCVRTEYDVLKRRIVKVDLTSRFKGSTNRIPLPDLDKI